VQRSARAQYIVKGSEYIVVDHRQCCEAFRQAGAPRLLSGRGCGRGVGFSTRTKVQKKDDLTNDSAVKQSKASPQSTYIQAKQQ